MIRARKQGERKARGRFSCFRIKNNGGNIMDSNLLQKFQWENQSDVKIDNDSILIKAHPNSDFFNDPSSGGNMSKRNAAFYYTDVKEDFVLRAKVTHQFKSVYDACTLMVMSNDCCWAKLCFELTDFGTHAVVSVVTNGVSDDANGVNIDGNTVYLQMAKKDKVFALHYSLDGNEYKMVRYFSLPVDDIFKAGFVAQSPMGEGGEYMFENIVLKNESISDMRKGV